MSLIIFNSFIYLFKKIIYEYDIMTKNNRILLTLKVEKLKNLLKLKEYQSFSKKQFNSCLFIIVSSKKCLEFY